MDREISSSTQYQPVTVDVPEDRVAEFHAFFARFLAGPTGRGRGGRHGRPHHGRHGHRHERAARCAARRESAEPSQPTADSTEL
jgi:hypothetical protein